MTLNDFTEHYQKISNTELLAILDSPEEYQELAVEAAKEELNRRSLSEKEINEARQPLELKKEQKIKQVEKVKQFESVIKTAGQNFIDTINPIQSKIHSEEKTINLIVIILGGIFLFQVIKDFNLHIAVILDFPRFPMESIMHILPLLTLGTGTFLFWKKKKNGWILLSIFLTFSIVTALGIILRTLTWKPSRLPNLDSIFPRPDPLIYIVALVFLTGAIMLLCKSTIREVYSIDKQKMIKIIGITGIITTLILVLNS
jgi:hypothetical protein